jgi:cobalamin biosynthesis protein CobD/CbiB
MLKWLVCYQDKEIEMNHDSKLILLGALLIAIIVFGPFFTIWALNTLFPALVIPYTFETWAATIILGSVFKTNIIKK